MAIEDAGALGILLKDIPNDQIAERLDLFQRVRKNRASRVQILSKARVGKEVEVEAEVREWAEDPSIRKS